MSDQSSKVELVQPNRNVGGIGGNGSASLFDIPEIDNAIYQRGVRMIHMTAMPCPVGRLSLTDSTHRPHADHAGCQGGFIYTNVGVVTCLFSSNSRRMNWTDQGMADGDTVSITLPRFYDNTNIQVKAMPFDRLYLAEESISVVQWELAEYSDLGVDALKFPVVYVESLIDWRGEYYKQDVDFTVKNGKIHWGSRAPGINPDTGLGGVYSVRYAYHPFYIIDSIGHEIRVATQVVNGQKIAVPMPYQISVVRENVARNADNDPQSPAAGSRQQQSPVDEHATSGYFIPTP